MGGPWTAARTLGVIRDPPGKPELEQRVLVHLHLCELAQKLLVLLGVAGLDEIIQPSARRHLLGFVAARKNLASECLQRPQAFRAFKGVFNPGHSRPYACLDGSRLDAVSGDVDTCLELGMFVLLLGPFRERRGVPAKYETA